jgi:hypothetical protein
LISINERCGGQANDTSDIGAAPGVIIAPQNVLFGSGSKKVAFHGPNELIAWFLTVQYVADRTRIVFSIVPTFQDIMP